MQNLLTIKQTCEQTGIPRRTLEARLKRYGIKPEIIAYKNNQYIAEDILRIANLAKYLEVSHEGYVSITECSIKFNIQYFTLLNRVKNAKLIPHKNISYIGEKYYKIDEIYALAMKPLNPCGRYTEKLIKQRKLENNEGLDNAMIKNFLRGKL